jgi:hypothetical protein
VQAHSIVGQWRFCICCAIGSQMASWLSALRAYSPVNGRKIPGTHSCSSLRRHPRHCAAGRIRSANNSKESLRIGAATFPQQTTAPRAHSEASTAPNAHVSKHLCVLHSAHADVTQTKPVCGHLLCWTPETDARNYCVINEYLYVCSYLCNYRYVWEAVAIAQPLHSSTFAKWL